MPLLSEAELKAEVRGRLGDPSITELPDAQLDRAFLGGLREFSRFRPIFEAFEFTTEPGVSDYLCPEGTVEVTSLWTVEEGFQISPGEILLEGLPPEELFAELERLGFDPADNAFWDWQVLQPTTAENPDPVPVLRVHPTPDYVFSVLARASKLSEFKNITERDQETLMLHMQGDCMVHMGMKRSTAVRRIPTATGILHLDDGSALRSEGRQLKKEFRKRLGDGATVVQAG